MRSKLLTLCGSLVLVLFAFSALAQSGDVEVKDAWARATPGGAQTAALYVTLRAPAGDRLIGVSTPAAKEAELHSMSMDNGVMKMRQIDGLNLPAGETVTLKPGGYHVMLTGLAQPLKEGQTFPLTLTFAKAGSQNITVTVQKVGAMGPSTGTDMPGMSMPMHH